MEQITIPAASIKPGDIILTHHRGEHYKDGWGLVYMVKQLRTYRKETTVITGGVGRLITSKIPNDKLIHVRRA